VKDYVRRLSSRKFQAVSTLTRGARRRLKPKFTALAAGRFSAVRSSFLRPLWLGYIAWAAARHWQAALSSPAIAQWFALAAGPLALLGLCWILFGGLGARKPNGSPVPSSKCAPRLGHSKACSRVLSERIQDNRTELTMIAQHLMQLGDETTNKLGGITREFDFEHRQAVKHGIALDRRAESARNDMAVLSRRFAPCRSNGAEHVGTASGRWNGRIPPRDRLCRAGQCPLRRREVGRSRGVLRGSQLLDHLSRVESSGTAAAASITDANSRMLNTTDQLLTRAAASLEQIRSGIDTQAAAVASLRRAVLCRHRPDRRGSGRIARLQCLRPPMSRSTA
jgi:hypothetical protein